MTAQLDRAPGAALGRQPDQPVDRTRRCRRRRSGRGSCSSPARRPRSRRRAPRSPRRRDRARPPSRPGCSRAAAAVALPRSGTRRDGVARRKRPARGERRVLADRVPDDGVRPQTARLDGRRQASDAVTSAGCWISVSVSSSSGPSKQSRSRSRPDDLAPDLEDLVGLGKRLCERSSHADLLRPLAGKAECDLHAATLPAKEGGAPREPGADGREEHRAPSLSRPSACASASASGIDALDVLP